MNTRSPGRWESYGRMARHVAPTGSRLLDLIDGSRGDGGLLLDLGSGSGLGLHAASNRGWAAVGIDRSADQIDAAGADVRQVLGDGMEIPFAAASFTAVVSNFAMIFAADVDRVAVEVGRVVRPGGAFAFSAWRPGGWPGVWRRRMATVLGREPAPFPTALGEPTAAAELLERVGFIDVVVERGRLRWEFADPGDAVDTLTEAAGGLRMLRAKAIDAGAWPTVRDLLLDEAAERAVPIAGGRVAIDDEYLAVAGRRP